MTATYEYMTEGVALSEKMIGRTTAGSSEIGDIAKRFNQLAAQGWELMQITEVNVVGKVFKGSERRGVTVAVFRREV